MEEHNLGRFSLGVDVGTNSIGWALVSTGGQGERTGLVDWGSYVFTESFEEDAKGVRTTYAADRGRQRRARRTLRRRKYRRNKLTEVLVENGLLPADDKDRVRCLTQHAEHTHNGIREVHPYAIRAEAVQRRVEMHEFGKALYHLCRHRGFLSTRELMQLTLQHALGEDLKLEDEYELTAEEADESASEEAKETGKYKKQIAEFREQLRTERKSAGQALYEAMQRGERVRCRVYKKQWTTERKKEHDQQGQGYRLARQMLVDEFHLMWDEQQKHHPVLRDHDLRKRVFDAIFYQNPLQDQKKLRGYCSFHPSRRRARRASLLSQRTSVLQKLNQLRLIDRTIEKPKPKKGKKAQAQASFDESLELSLRPWDRKLTPEEVHALFETLQVRETLTWLQAKQVLGVPDTMVFSEEPVSSGKNPKTIEGARAYPHLVGNLTSAKMCRVVPDFLTWNLDKQEALVHDVLELTPAKAHERLTEIFGLSEQQARDLVYEEYPEGFASVCRKVQRKMEPFLLQGMVYSEAMAAAGYDHAKPRTEVQVDRLSMDMLPVVNNPIVKRAVAQAFKVINAVIDKYGKPTHIRLEIPRDVSLTNKQREEVWKRQDGQRKARKQAEDLLRQNGLDVFRGNVDKVLLWQEFDGVSPYEPKTPITLGQLATDYDIDHILPRSRTADDSWTNKTICSRNDNLLKGNKTPFETWRYTDRWKDIQSICGKYSRRKGFSNKVKNILIENLDEVLADGGFVGRQLSDTRYISRLVLNSVQRLGVDVQVGRGGLTAMVRRLWGLEELLQKPKEMAQEPPNAEEAKASTKPKKKVREDHRHHAVDALAVACTDLSLFQRLTRYYQCRENRPVQDREPLDPPWPGFIKEAVGALPRAHIVHAPNRRVRGAIHEETARKPPPKHEVDAALQAMPPERRKHVREFVQVGKQLVRMDAEGNPLCAYNLGNNHHGVVWRSRWPNPQGEYRWDFSVVTVLEARSRIRAGEPLYQRERGEWVAHMHLCKGDIVEWDGELLGFEPGFYRASSLFDSGGAHIIIRLFPLTAAQSNWRNALTIQSKAHLRHFTRRVSFGPLGDIAGWQAAP